MTPTTPQERQLRQNIRNLYCGATLEEIVRGRNQRSELGRGAFELACFDELIRESRQS